MPERKIVRRRESMSVLSQYNTFCKSLKEGDILYNRNNNQEWGKLFLVAAKMVMVLNGEENYLLLLLGLDINGNKIIPNGKRIDITPQRAFFTVYLRKVGKCEYNLVPKLYDYKVNKGLMVVYSDADLQKFIKVVPHKPKEAKYGDDGRPLLKTTTNKNVLR